MKKIIPHLWFDKEGREAAEFYISAFGDGKIISSVILKDTPGGDSESVTFEILGTRFMSISAGPIFRPNPSISFMVNFDPSKDSSAAEKLESAWNKLMEGGNALMDLGEYPFSKKYGWVEDKYGVSWQLILTNPEGEERPAIMPSLLFVGDVCGKAEAALDHYAAVFKDTRKGTIVHYSEGMEPEKSENLMFGEVMIEGGNWIIAMDSASPEHKFGFTEGVSLIVNCDTQEEIDYYWEKLSAVPLAEQCGWLKDKFGISWQISATRLDEMMSNGTPEQIARVVQTFLPMKKIDIATIEKAYKGE